MTPNELYNLPTESLGALHILKGCYYNHIPELDGDIQLWNAASERIVIRILKDFDFDGRRYWRLATVWFDGVPCMIIQNAGREGDDHARRYITDPPGFLGLLRHLHEIAASPLEVDNDKEVIDPDVDAPYLTEFYGNSLDGHFERYRY